MNYPKVPIIILNWNGLEDTIECLESLKKITYPNYEVIVVDNGSEGDEAEALEGKFGNHIYIIKNDRNYGFVGGNNIAIRWLLINSKPDYFLLLNNDTVVDPEFLTEMVKVTESDPSIGIAGPKTYFYDDPDRFQLVWVKMDMWKGQSTHIGARQKDNHQYDRTREVDFVPGSCILVKREVMDNIGLLDESYFNYWEETEYCIRTRRAGYKVVFVPKAKIWHKVSKSSSKVGGFTQYFLTRNRFKFMKKYATRGQYVCFLLYFFGFRLFRNTAVHLVYHRDIKSLLGFWRGIKHGLLSSENK